MKKIIILLLIINCSSIKFVEVDSKIKTREQYLIETAIKRYDLNIVLHVVKTDEIIDNLQKLNGNKKLFVYFYGVNNNSKHFNYGKTKTENLGFYHKDHNFITYTKDNLFKLSEEKQIGVIMHEIGHALDLKHYDNNCNYMISGIDNCKNYTYEQLKHVKDYLNYNAKTDINIKYFFGLRHLNINTKNYKKNGYIHLYLIID